MTADLTTVLLAVVGGAVMTAGFAAVFLAAIRVGDRRWARRVRRRGEGEARR